MSFFSALCAETHPGLAPLARAESRSVLLSLNAENALRVQIDAAR